MCVCVCVRAHSVCIRVTVSVHLGQQPQGRCAAKATAGASPPTLPTAKTPLPSTPGTMFPSQAHPQSLEVETGCQQLQPHARFPRPRGNAAPDVQKTPAKSFGICLGPQSQLTGLFPAWEQGEGTRSPLEATATPPCPSALRAPLAPLTPCTNQKMGGCPGLGMMSPPQADGPAWTSQTSICETRACHTGPQQCLSPGNFLREAGPQGTYILHKKVGPGLRLPVHSWFGHSSVWLWAS